MRSGPRAKTPEHKKAAGTDQPCRAVTTLYGDHASRPDPEVIEPPKWLNAAAKRIWRTKADRYRQRGQKISGFEDSLAQYCALEAELIDMRKKKIVPPMAMVTSHRIWCAEFYDTPASQNVKARGDKGSNSFGQHGKR